MVTKVNSLVETYSREFRRTKIALFRISPVVKVAPLPSPSPAKFTYCEYQVPFVSILCPRQVCSRVQPPLSVPWLLRIFLCFCFARYNRFAFLVQLRDALTDKFHYSRRFICYAELVFS